MVKLTFVVAVIFFSLFLLVYGRPIDSDHSIIDFNDDKATFNGKILLDTIFVDTTIPPAEDAKSVGSKVKTKKIESESKSKPADIAKQGAPVPAKSTSAGLLATAPQPIGLNLFGPQGLSERFLQDPRSRLLLSRLGANFLDSLTGQQNQRNSRQLSSAGFAGGNAFNTAGGLNGLLNAFNPAAAGAGRAPSGFNAGNLLNLIAPQPQPKVGGSFDIIPPKNFQGSVQGPPSSDIFGVGPPSVPSSVPDDSSNFFCNMLRFFLSRLF